MKQLITLSLIALFLYSCGSDTVNNSTTGPVTCTKSVSLIYPAADTVLTQLNNVRFVWSTATCNPVGYKLELSHDSNFALVYSSFSLTDTTAYSSFQNNGGAWSYWRVKAFYGSPVSDSILSSRTGKLKYQP